MDLFSLDPAVILTFIFALMRISLILFMMPFFGGAVLPATVKAALCLTLTLALWPRLPLAGVQMPGHPFALAVMLGAELLLGLILGMVIRFVFAAIQTGGQLIGFQMGFAMVNVVDPDSGASEAVTAHFMYMVSLLTFLAINGHLYLLSGLMKSFDLLPPGSILISSRLTDQIFVLSGQIFVLAIQIGAPVIAAILLVDLALALISRASPQMNVLIIGFPIKIAVGFLFMGIIFEIISLHMEGFVSRMPLLFTQLIGAMR
ncbi:flagellar biosynthetic protein FliR [Desulfomicrobium macestii]|uniref:Flagellar biosynthetic protein FliR n=2 Tax=Desulfomicrobium TaxID=898 RepID=A0A8G2F6E6_DESNO|nr:MULTISPECIES: flagellar biosynthetic protein FliR [Desulfomicrobium]MBE1426584.1 flagellar biosynthetic protein FliR [Desulfomicrobium macestii]SFL36253.1 flagellar biosynthetic protein FliR [Desulfomicrobium norvegicum]